MHILGWALESPIIRTPRPSTLSVGGALLVVVLRCYLACHGEHVSCYGEYVWCVFVIATPRQDKHLMVGKRTLERRGKQKSPVVNIRAFFVPWPCGSETLRRVRVYGLGD